MKTAIVSMVLLAQNPTATEIDRRTTQIESKVVAWRRDIHEHPELGNRETRTAKIVADHLRSLGIEVKTGVAHTGVVGVLRGGRPGKVVALRADMDALPVTEQVNLPFASKVKTTYNGQEVGVMHACGHDTHVAILMGVAEVLAGMKNQLPGTVKFIFQPAEEGAPAGEEGGAELMIKEGALDNPRPSAIFGLHIWSLAPVGTVQYTSGPAMASADTFSIAIRGKQVHAANPHLGVDPMTGSEDFSYYQKVIPGFCWFLGGGNEKLGIAAAHHTPEFNIDEAALAPGVKLAANQLLDYLDRHK